MRYSFILSMCLISIFFSTLVSIITHHFGYSFINTIFGMLRNNLLNASYIAQVGLFAIGIYALLKDKRKTENIRLSNLCYNLIKTYNYVQNWGQLLKNRTFEEITPDNIEDLNKIYIKNEHFLANYHCEHEKVERSLGLLKVKYLKFKFPLKEDKSIKMEDINAVYFICIHAKYLLILKDSLRRYSIYNKHKNSSPTSNEVPEVDNEVAKKQWREAIEHIDLCEKNLCKVKKVIINLNSYLPKDTQYVFDKQEYR